MIMGICSTVVKSYIYTQIPQTKEEKKKEGTGYKCGKKKNIPDSIVGRRIRTPFHIQQ
jgi:hypothetical protein